jgi:2-haloacid dehalogenase
MLAGIKALTFDTGGTILNWHTGLCQDFAHAGAQHGLSADWPEITNEYCRPSLKIMVSAVNPRSISRTYTGACSMWLSRSSSSPR